MEKKYLVVDRTIPFVVWRTDDLEDAKRKASLYSAETFGTLPPGLAFVNIKDSSSGEVVPW